MYRIFYFEDVNKTIYAQDFQTNQEANKLVDSLKPKKQWVAYHQVDGIWHPLHMAIWPTHESDMARYPINYIKNTCKRCEDVISSDQSYCTPCLFPELRRE